MLAAWFWGCGGQKGQSITGDNVTMLPLTESSPVMIRSVNSGKVIDIYNGVNANGARIQQ